MIKKEMIAMLLAGGQGSRLGVYDSRGGETGVAFMENIASSIFLSATVLILGVDTVGVLINNISPYG